jgi:anti-sigma regulatory factor (Ser/Thr protein kinase)
VLDTCATDSGEFMQARDCRHSQEELACPSSAPLYAGSHCRTTLAPLPESIKAAREFTTAALRGWRLDALIEDAVTVASELVTNALRHAGGHGGSTRDPRIELAWYYEKSRLMCVVTDWSTQPPVPLPADSDAEAGRGLQIVAALTAGWGWTRPGAHGKAVWAVFSLPGAGPDADGPLPGLGQAWAHSLASLMPMSASGVTPGPPAHATAAQMRGLSGNASP